ncbi:hypothetical protein M8J77_013467 [Diaphorina citri]|nr:hypothetical protein M8J77_013467 [Diaphorina citri]
MSPHLTSSSLPSRRGIPLALNKCYESNTSVLVNSDSCFLVYEMKGSNDSSFKILFDTGSSLTIVNKSHVDDALINPRPDLVLTGAGNSLLNVAGDTNIYFTINNIKFSHKAIVVENLSQDIILGTDFLIKHKANINYESGLITAVVGGTHVLLVDFRDRGLSPLTSNTEPTTPSSSNLSKVPVQSNIIEQDRPVTNYTRDVEIVSKVTCSKDVTIQAKSSKVVPILTDHNIESIQNGVFEVDLAFNSRYGLFAPISEFNCANALRLEVFNTTNYPTTVKAGTTIGHIYNKHFYQCNNITFFTHNLTSSYNINTSPCTRSADTSKSPPVDLGNREIDINPDLPLDQYLQAKQLITDYIDIFAKDAMDLEEADLIDYKITLTDDDPVTSAPYKLSPKEQQEMDRQIDQLLKADVIQESKSSYSSPAFLIPKSDGSSRLVIDYRKLNQKIIGDQFPQPKIQNLFDCLEGSQFYCSMDINSAFYQQKVAPEDRKYTAFTTHNRLLEFKRLPFGLKLSPAIYNRALSRVFSNLLYHGLLLYLDDIITYQTDFQSALDLLGQVFERIRATKLKLKSTKCHFFYNKIEILGHEVSNLGTKPLTKNIDAIQNMEIPRTQKQLRSFIGAVSFYRKFIPKLSTILSPLTDLTRNEFDKKKLPWAQVHTDAFLKVKNLLINPPLLAYYKQGRETVFSQRPNLFKGESHPIAYVSRRLQKNELNYSASEIELLSIVYCVNYWRQYLYGIKFKVINDHASLRYFKNVRNNNSRLGRLAFKLIDYDLEILHKKNLKFVDYLSRNPVAEVVSEDQLERQDYLHSFKIETVNLEKLQREDEFLGEIYKVCLDPDYPATRHITRNSRHYCVDHSDNLLYYKKYSPQGRKLLLAVPKSLQSKILTSYHADLETGCHLGTAKILSLLSSRYYWPSMVRDLTHLIRTCEQCQLRKSPKSATKGLLHPVPIPSKPFTTVVIDYLGPLHKSNGKEYIIVGTDPTTKFAFAKATAKADANTTVSFIIDICTLFGIPLNIQTDRGSHFTSQVVTQLLKGLNISHGLSPAYRPQAQGITERFNSTICDMLSHFVDDNGKKWDKYVNWVCHAYNSTRHASTNESPFYLLHGYEPRSTVDLTLLPKDTEHDVLEALEILDNIRSKLPDLIRTVQLKNKDRYDRTHIFDSFEVDDEVLVYDPTYKTKPRGKFENRYKGPFKIARKITENIYEVELIKNNQLVLDQVHISRLKKFFRR